MTPLTVRLAYLRGPRDCEVNKPGDDAAAWLVSYYYLERFAEGKAGYYYRDWVMDSGAFSAHNSGVAIHIKDYIATCAHLLKTDPMLTEVYALDVIGDHKASLRNCELMWEYGIPAIPCFHAGEPWDLLTHLAQHYPKIAIGGVARARDDVKQAFSQECFARVWPKRIHGFGMSNDSLVLGFPFHSTDSSSWEMGPLAFGRWLKFGAMDAKNKNFSSGRVDLRSQIKYFLNLEAKARVRWSKQMQLLETLEER